MTKTSMAVAIHSPAVRPLLSRFAVLAVSSRVAARSCRSWCGRFVPTILLMTSCLRAWMRRRGPNDRCAGSFRGSRQRCAGGGV
jgi:predicted metal-binding membrane protein